MTRAALPPPQSPGPAWAVARLFPDQGQWDNGDYLELNRGTNHLIEFDDGTIEVLEVPMRSHQRIVLYLYNALNRFVGAVDPRDRGVTVLRLAGKRYAVAGTFGAGERAASTLIGGFEIDVTALFAAAGRVRGQW